MLGASILTLILSWNGVPLARSVPARAEQGWVLDGRRICRFESGDRDEACSQYHRDIAHSLKNGQKWTEYRWMWRGVGGHEVRYTSRLGLMGVSTFTIGTLRDPHSKLPGHGSENAVSYAPSREELIIGVPGEGYEFSVKGRI